MITIDGIQIEPTIFPDKTSQVWHIPTEILEKSSVTIEWRFESEAELIHVAQLNSLLRQSVPHVELYLPYLPYARQDKEISNDATFALRTFAQLINTCRFDKVTTLDAHSALGDEIIGNFYSRSPRGEIRHAIAQVKANMIAYPDAGACTRYATSAYLADFPLIIGNKTRDQATGYITGYEFEGDPKGSDVLIIDDLIDGGKTFTIFAKDLLIAGAKSVNLYATHGIFSKGLEVLFDDGISRIFTQDGEHVQPELFRKQFTNTTQELF
jgi:ribose-phosphate pyrophosphokinase